MIEFRVGDWVLVDHEWTLAPHKGEVGVVASFVVPRFGNGRRWVVVRFPDDTSAYSFQAVELSHASVVDQLGGIARDGLQKEQRGEFHD